MPRKRTDGETLTVGEWMLTLFVLGIPIVNLVMYFAWALSETGNADLLVLACDYPRVDTTLMRKVVLFADEGDENLVMLTDPAGRDHPLVAAWQRSAAPVVREAVEEGRFKVLGLLPDLDVRRLGPVMLPGLDLGRVLLNVNWPDDLRKLG